MPAMPPKTTSGLTCRFDTDGDGNCAMTMCPACHPENFTDAQLAHYESMQKVPTPWTAKPIANAYALYDANDVFIETVYAHNGRSAEALANRIVAAINTVEDEV